jgi:hypothetical protein
MSALASGLREPRCWARLIASAKRASSCSGATEDVALTKPDRGPIFRCATARAIVGAFFFALTIALPAPSWSSSRLAV